MIAMSSRKSTNVEVVNVVDPLALRPLLDEVNADALTALYKVLANPHRLRLLHALARAGEMPVSMLADEVAMSIQAVSNQLQRLTDQRILAVRRQGNQAFYRIIDPCVSGLLELGMCLVEQNPPA
jgi:ArsR family transcriptional regulator, lead/cadmium/zinc/bismuth-responsive transcriptional repressor